MNILNKLALVLGAALVAAPVYAGAAQEGGTVCGRVDAPSSYILQLEQASTPGNVVYARSQSEVVQAKVKLDGTFCFNNLNTDVHTLSAFSDAFSGPVVSVTPKSGQTLQVEIVGAEFSPNT